MFLLLFNLSVMTFKMIILSAFILGLISLGASSEETIRVALENSDNSPYSKVSLDQKVITGLHIDIVSSVAKKIGFKIKWVPLPWNRAIMSVVKGEVDAIIYVSPSKEREVSMVFLPNNILHKDQICVVVRKDFKEKKYNGKIESLYGEKVGISTNYVVSQEIFINKNKFNLFESTVEGDQIMSMLAAGRFDYTFTSVNGLKRLKTKSQFNNLMKLSPCLSGDDRYIAFSKKYNGHLNWAQKFEEAMKAWKQSDEYKKILAYYDL